jgi:hypothetical protein
MRVVMASSLLISSATKNEHRPRPCRSLAFRAAGAEQVQDLVAGQPVAVLADTILRPVDDGDVVGAFGQSDQLGSEVLLE